MTKTLMLQFIIKLSLSLVLFARFVSAPRRFRSGICSTGGSPDVKTESIVDTQLRKYSANLASFGANLTLGDRVEPEILNSDWWNAVGQCSLTSTSYLLNQLNLCLSGEDEEGRDLFRTDKLKDMSEATHQSEYISKRTMVLDTHSSNSIARPACVSLIAHGTDTYGFNSKPDAIHSAMPVFLEIKSRVTRSTASGSLFPDESVAEQCEPKRQRVTVTLTEKDLLQQMMERIVQNMQFRAHFSQVVVLGSTGHLSLCMSLRQSFIKQPLREVNLAVVSNETIDAVWDAATHTVSRVGPACFLTNDGPMILHSLQHLTENADMNFLLNIRISLANLSRASVYYVTVPDKLLLTVSSTVKTCALKVVHDSKWLAREFEALELVKKQWERDGVASQFYYRGCVQVNGNEMQSNLRGKMAFSGYSPGGLKWLDGVSFPDCGGVIVMRAACREELDECADKEKAYHDLNTTLRRAFKVGVVHGDVRAPNCMLFPPSPVFDVGPDEVHHSSPQSESDWQVIDFDHAVLLGPATISSGGGTASNDSVETYIEACSGQAYGCGYGLKKKFPDLLNEDLKGAKIRVNVSDITDNEMLFNALLNCHRN